MGFRIADTVTDSLARSVHHNPEVLESDFLQPTPPLMVGMQRAESCGGIVLLKLKRLRSVPRRTSLRRKVSNPAVYLSVPMVESLLLHIGNHRCIAMGCSMMAELKPLYASC